MLSELHAALGLELIAVIANRDLEAVNSWLSGAPVPAYPARLLEAAHTVLEIITENDGTATARAWFSGLNNNLDDESPAEVIADGRTGEAIAAARHFATNG